jgi:tripartite-type tricarboxylate transporter receptor subunit TctC
MFRVVHLLLSSILLSGLFLNCFAAGARAVSFEHKRINLLIGFSPVGFGYDTYGRSLARHLGKHLPGNPSVVPQNRPGAGSPALMNQLYNTSAKDGTEIALVGRGAAMDPLLSGAASGAKFEAIKFNWIGSMNSEVAGFFISDKALAKSLDEILAGRAISVGSTGAGGDPQVFARALNGILNTNLKPVAGYPGMNEILLGIARGELDGVLGYSWGVAKLGSQDELASGRLKIILQLALKGHAGLRDVPLVMDLVSEGDGRNVLELIFSRQAMGRPLVAPPGLEPEVVAALRKGFADTMKDPEFLAESEKLSLEVNFVRGSEVQAIVNKVYSFPDAVTKRAQELVK